MTKEFWNTALEDFKQLTKNPETLLTTENNLSNDLKVKIKGLYDFSKSEEIKAHKTNALPELIVKNFDLEQIWQQIELQNDEVLTSSLTNISKLLVGKDKLVFKGLEDKIADHESEAEENHDPSGSDQQEPENQSVESYDEELDLNDKNESMSEEEEDKNQPQSSKNFKRSIVDDNFFKLSEMENFLNEEEKKLNDPDSGNNSESEEGEEEGSIDLFEGDSGEDEEEEKVKIAKFKDFFVENSQSLKKPTRNKFLEEMSNDDSEPDEINEQVKSTLEMRQERLKKKIEDIEENAVSEKPWQLKGEITAESRPQNSLLEEVVEFDLTTRPAPIITEQTTLQLEDIIRQRIKDKVFDSVERKIKPVETPLEYKKKLVLNQEKSKQSLAQIYEKEYIDQKTALDPENADKEEEELPLHKEVKTMMKDLFHKLDALSNFHFTPKPAIPELKIVSNLPAISMEEVAPVAASNATILAPEEIRNKTKGDILGKTERTRTDKNRERRKKKKKQRIHLKAKEQREKNKKKVEIGVPKKYGKVKSHKSK